MADESRNCPVCRDPLPEGASDCPRCDPEATREPSALPNIPGHSSSQPKKTAHRAWTAAAIALIGLPFLPGLLPIEAAKKETPEPSPLPPMVVAVAPFYGPDPESQKEGRTLAVLIERAILERFEKDEATVIGLEETGEPVRHHESARSLGERLKADVVIWGEALSVGSETEFRSVFTKAVRTGSFIAAPEDWVTADQGPVRVASVVAGARAQVDARKAEAAEIADVVLLLAATRRLDRHELDVRTALANGWWSYPYGWPRLERDRDEMRKALQLLDRAPESVQALVYRAEALRRLRGGFSESWEDETKEVAVEWHERAMVVLARAAVVGPREAQPHASMGDLLLEAGNLDDAIAAYRRAEALGTPYKSRLGVFLKGRLYVLDVLAGEKYVSNSSRYVLVIDPAENHVLHRYHLGDVGGLLSVEGDAVRITGYYNLGGFRVDENGMEPRVVRHWFTDNRPGPWPAPVMPGPFTSSSRSTANYWGVPGRGGQKRTFENETRGAEEVERELRKAAERDSTEPWHLFLLGKSLWSRGEEAAATEAWERLLAGDFHEIPSYEFAKMAREFEDLGRHTFADRAFLRALRRNTEAWHLFFLGKRLWSQGEQTAATETWERLFFAQDYPEMSQHEFSQMGREFAKLGQISLVNRIASKARTAHDRGEPVKYINSNGLRHEAPFLRRVFHDPERAHLWLTRARQLSGVPVEEELPVSALWARYFRERGDEEKARAEEAVLEKGSREPLGLLRLRAWFRALVVLLVTCMFVHLLLLVLLTGKAITGGLGPAGRGGRLATSIGGISSGQRRVLVLSYLVGIVVWVLFLDQFEKGSAAEMVNDLGFQGYGTCDAPLYAGWPNEVHWVMAVKCQRANEWALAAREYEQLGEDPRAKHNLESLKLAMGWQEDSRPNRTSPTLEPPERVTPDDVTRAAWVGVRVRGFQNSQKTILESWPAAAWTVLLLLAFFWIPPTRILSGRPGGWLRRAIKGLGFFVVPGTYDLLRGSPSRGLLTIFLAFLPVFAYRDWISYGGWHPWLSYGVPWPNDPGSLSLHQGWDVVVAYPGLAPLVGTLALASLAAIALHVSRFGRIWASVRSTSAGETP